jgi:hypothetical protein
LVGDIEEKYAWIASWKLCVTREIGDWVFVIFMLINIVVLAK